MNHFKSLPDRVRGKRRSRMLSSNNELDMHHKWYVVMCVVRSSLGFPSNLGIFVGILTRIVGQGGWCCMGLFVSLDRLGSSRAPKKRNYILVSGFWFKGNGMQTRRTIRSPHIWIRSRCITSLIWWNPKKIISPLFLEIMWRIGDPRKRIALGNIDNPRKRYFTRDMIMSREWKNPRWISAPK